MTKLSCAISILALFAPAWAVRHNINAQRTNIEVHGATHIRNQAFQIETKAQSSKASSCEAVTLPADEAERVALGGIKNMDALINNQNVMTYAWGPAFKGEGQIFAWGNYNANDKKIQFWYGKHDHIMRDSSNQIGAGMRTACYWKLGDKCPDLAHQFPKKTFGPGGTDEQVNFAGYGRFEITQVEGRWRFTAPGKPGCYLDHVFACTDKNAEVVYAGKC